AALGPSSSPRLSVGCLRRGRPRLARPHHPDLPAQLPRILNTHASAAITWRTSRTAKRAFYDRRRIYLLSVHSKEIRCRRRRPQQQEKKKPNNLLAERR